MNMSNACADSAGYEAKGVDFGTVLPLLPASHADQHQVTVRNTFIEVDDVEPSPIVERQRAKTSISDLLDLMENRSAEEEPEVVHVRSRDGVEECEQPSAKSPSIGFDKSLSRKATVLCGDSVDCDRSEEVQPQDCEDRDRCNGRTINIRNTFIDISDEDVTTPLQRQGKRAQTWHARPFFCDNTPSTLTLDDDNEFQSQTDGTLLGVDEDTTSVSSSYSYLVSLAQEGSDEPCELQCCSGLATRVRAPPPLSRIHSPTSGTCVSAPQTLSTTASSGARASPCEISITPSIASDLPSTVASGCGHVLDVSSIATPHAILTHCALPSDVQQCSTGPPQHNMHSDLPDLSAGTATNVVPLYAFPCSPEVTIQSLPSTTFASLLPSIGSAGHHKGSCKPCAFGSDRCKNGVNCAFCHICKPIEKTKRGRWILKRRKPAQELMSEALDLQNVLSKAFAA